MTAGPLGGAQSEFRAFVRRHHPDVGGDPETFRAGLAAFRSVGARPPLPEAGPAGPRWAGPSDDDPRLDAPVTVAPDAALRRLGRAGRRFLHRRISHPLRHRSPRVL